MSEKQSPIQIKISASLKAKFERKCKENGKTITAVLKELMESYINDDGSEQEQDTLADADLQQLKDELYSLQCRLQSLDEKAEKSGKRTARNLNSILDLEEKIDDVPNQLQQHHNKMMEATKQYVDKQLSEKQMLLDTSNNNTSLSAQEEGNDDANNGKLS